MHLDQFWRFSMHKYPTVFARVHVDGDFEYSVIFYPSNIVYSMHFSYAHIKQHKWYNFKTHIIVTYSLLYDINKLCFNASGWLFYLPDTNPETDESNLMFYEDNLLFRRGGCII